MAGGIGFSTNGFPGEINEELADHLLDGITIQQDLPTAIQISKTEAYTQQQGCGGPPELDELSLKKLHCY